MYQEPTVFPDLTVAENVFAGRQPRGSLHAVDWGAMRSEAMRILDELGAEFGPDTPVLGLGVADRQLLEIAKALSSSARVLIMDEPTAALSPNEVEKLFATVRGLRERGVAVVYISHRLEEVAAIADVVTVLRDGRHIETQAGGRAPAGRDHPPDGGPLARRPLPEGGRRDRRGRAQGGRPDPPRCLLERLVRAPSRRDRRPGRLRGLRSHRGRAQHLRDRSARGRRALDRRPHVQAALPESGARPGARLPAGGQAPPGARAADVRRHERLDGGPARIDPGRDPPAAARARARPPLHGAAADQGDVARAGRPQPLGRQPAEGRARRSGSRRSRGSCSSTSRRTASTSAPRPTSTGRSRTSPRRASRSSSSPPSCRRFSA